MIRRACVAFVLVLTCFATMSSSVLASTMVNDLRPALLLSSNKPTC